MTTNFECLTHDGFSTVEADTIENAIAGILDELRSGGCDTTDSHRNITEGEDYVEITVIAKTREGHQDAFFFRADIPKVER